MIGGFKGDGVREYWMCTILGLLLIIYTVLGAPYSRGFFTSPITPRQRMINLGFYLMFSLIVFLWGLVHLALA